jgi:GNAT superfamily N-acetyltransferase
MSQNTGELPESPVGRASEPRDARFTVRPACREDAEVLVNLVRELAVYEKREHRARATADDFRRHLFGPRPVAEAALAEVPGQAVGFALWFPTFSTFMGRPGLYLEDLFVRPEFRGRGIGKGLLAAVARIAVERECDCVCWSVLNWNEAAMGFYDSLGARQVRDWTAYVLEQESLRRLAEMAQYS